VRVIDATLRVLTETGPGWYRYNHDGYGERADGSPFDGFGVGRPWPLLAGERAHYELAAGRPDVAVKLLGVVRAQASDGGMLPEQIWDGPNLPELELENGRASGSAMPLVWAHAEYAKLVRSLHDGRVFDMPQQPYERYVRTRTECTVSVWAPHGCINRIIAGRTLRIHTPLAVRIDWSSTGDATVRQVVSRDSGVGLWIADLDTASLPAGTEIRFRAFVADVASGERFDEHVVTVVAAPQTPSSARASARSRAEKS